jgi:hypothetical protein
MSKKKPPERFANLEHLLRHGGSYLIGDTKSIDPRCGESVTARTGID